MQLDEECKGCLFRSQQKKVKNSQSDNAKLAQFEEQVRALCANPPATYCAPLMMRDIDKIHRNIFGAGIDYSQEKNMFNACLLKMEEELKERIFSSSDPLQEAICYAMAANYIDFAQAIQLDEGSIVYIEQAAKKSHPDGEALEGLRNKLQGATTLCYVHDNCGEIVLDKILISVIKQLYPQITVTSIVRGGAIINDVTVEDARQVDLYSLAEVVENGVAIPGTYLKEVNARTLQLLQESDVVISKGLGNLETLFGEGYEIFFMFMCKCQHIALRFGHQLMETALVWDKNS